MRATFEFTRDGSNKFWNISIDGARVHRQLRSPRHHRADAAQDVPQRRHRAQGA